MYCIQLPLQSKVSALSESLEPLQKAETLSRIVAIYNYLDSQAQGGTYGGSCLPCFCPSTRLTSPAFAGASARTLTLITRVGATWRRRSWR